MARRHHRKPRAPEGVFTARIDSLAHDGRGIARVDGKVVFIEGALPGETVEYRYLATRGGYDEALTTGVLEASPERVAPRCRHFGVCGGCSLQHLAADRQIAFKHDQLVENLERIGRVTPAHWLAPLTGPHWGYRQKARLGVRFVPKKDKVLVGFREKHAPYLADLLGCEVLHPSVGTRIEALSALIGSLSIKTRLPQIEVAVGEDGVALNFRVMDPPSAEDCEKLAAFGREHGIRILLQPGNAGSTHALWPDEIADLHYRLPAYDVELAFRTQHFTQVNADINRQMIARAIELLDVQPGQHVLDLFCGLGNFTLALARVTGAEGRVSGVEGEPALVEWAGRNAAANGIGNAGFHVADLTTDITTQTWRQARYDRILLDPPRSGALEMMPHVAAMGASRIVYVSCHPATLARDAAELVHTHGYRLEAAGVMDMFPHTTHVESIALFVRD
ncbi:MAG TPA: 23S rRNA (uracil(1939)-C(5))-methyltransferase RlmD [Plasticicumulans sp.]|uniref:23S rRNA (uracil(1939)-C(5))-methyltransferase RlmD n=1 Tax=Plasticicumulans sp. TaxID=2307179 RepID=UPI002B8BAE8B|nr:23S rRNA (uracil(1939)-C(5))-methyltransferase RlmD [Plasticicumulans sp.]HMV38395.1 23S rRNA (uracil(1939)-C(5))-methyltransferase RlmD [Plasticicumulans sp.]HMW29449.1 23S rRNA (uracil(1939)-C(5))-methyltransferase RlmD [Plasticicumulans sp.]HMX52908.1 23S rRNA (uracil(1939)-C(5))-methyltransferase RlmD [Plasticicumulans sp.]HNG49569.1 23S rRNA (uracil(1939)-C(5))-methyltransferase RlmD [Plasticicumulans sp.]HNI21824.1 23S rRNA (uracil(1939)-C(5))-methyltransferase RlmD [Plasticicumulans 